MVRFIKKAAALLVRGTILVSCISFALAAKASELMLSVISDIHYMPREFIGSPNGYNYRHVVDSDCRLAQYSDEILDAAIDNIIAAGSKYLIIPGDLSLSSQLQSHINIAQSSERLRHQGQGYVCPATTILAGEVKAVPPLRQLMS
jgi:hypothetical protein